MNSYFSKIYVYLISIVDTDDEDAGFGIDEENDGDGLIRSTQDNNAKKHDYIPSRNKIARTESFVVKRPSLKRKSGKNYVYRVQIENASNWM